MLAIAFNAPFEVMRIERDRERTVRVSKGYHSLMTAKQVCDQCGKPAIVIAGRRVIHRNRLAEERKAK